MEQLNAVNNIKQPAPNIEGNNENKYSDKQKRKIKMPNFGIITPSFISTTPQEDDFVRQQEQNPKIKFSASKKINKILIFKMV